MKKILIAEDDRILLMRLVKALEDFSDDLDVIDVANGKEAIDVLGKHQIALLVTDLNMPEVDGFLLLAHVNEHYPVIPCFVMTAMDVPEVEPKLPEDLVRFYAKPFDIDVFVKAVYDTVTRDIPSGVVRGISVASFCTMIAIEKKTCLFEIEPEKGDKGLLSFDRGDLCDASVAGLEGEAAAIQILGYPKANFKFRNLPDEPIQRRINKGLRELIDEGVTSKAGFDEIDWDQVVDDGDD